MQITFNTGRLYTPEGQIITALLMRGHIIFHDTSRGISGTIALPKLYTILTPAELERHVMSQYDIGAYTAC